MAINMKKTVYSIAIDGPAGAGKSTIAKELSKRLHILYLDTGAMYRALGLKAYEHKTDISDETAVGRLLSETCVGVKYKDGSQRTYLDGRDVSDSIREPHISKAASDISAVPAVRYKMVELQREIAAAHSMVLDGRDIGTFVLPDAKYKIFLTADPRVRAERRYLELTAKGQSVSRGEVLSEMLARDENDSKRAVAPLKKAADAATVDTSDLNPQEVVERILKIIENN